MQNNVVVELDGMAEGMCGLIVPCPSGIVYSNQTGGRYCWHPCLEGVYLPVPWAGVAAVAMAIFAEFNDVCMDGQPLGKCGDGADRLDAALKERPPDHYGEARVDRTRLDESHEAWVWLTISGCKYITGLEVTDAMMMWPNSD